MTSLIKENKTIDELLEDINAKMKIAKHVVVACEEEKYGRIVKKDNVSARMQFYTKTSPHLIYKFKSQIRKEKSLVQWINDQDVDNHVSCKPYEEIRDAVVNLYVNKREIPNRASLTRAFAHKEEWKDEDQIHDMKIRGFTWVPLPGTQKSIIVEKPEQVFKRQRYLQQIMRYREEGRSIVYVEERHLTLNGLTYEYYTLDPKAQYVCMVANESGLCNVFFHNQVNVDYIENYFDTFLLSSIPKSSVIVISERSHHTKVSAVPKETSLKSEMVNWLTQNDIPHNPGAHRAELFTLIQKCKRKIERNPYGCYKLEVMLKLYGHDVLYKPHGLPMLSFFKTYLNDVVRQETRKNTSPTHTLENVMDEKKLSYSTGDWKQFANQLIATEKKMHDEDMKMEVIIDQLLTMAKYNGISENDLPPDLEDESIQSFFWMYDDVISF